MEKVFYINLVIHYLILVFIVWGIVFFEKRIWPPPKRKSWQYSIYRTLFYIGWILDFYIIFQDFNNWVISDLLRYYIGIPFAILGGLFSIWGIYTLGLKNTYGLKDEFINHGPYFYTRNPQYLGDIILIIGLILFVNSLYFTIIGILAIFIFLIMPFSEEKWLEKEYGEKYLKYKKKVSRFF